MIIRERITITESLRQARINLEWFPGYRHALSLARHCYRSKDGRHWSTEWLRDEADRVAGMTE